MTTARCRGLGPATYQVRRPPPSKGHRVAPLVHHHHVGTARLLRNLPPGQASRCAVRALRSAQIRAAPGEKRSESADEPWSVLITNAGRERERDASLLRNHALGVFIRRERQGVCPHVCKPGPSGHSPVSRCSMTDGRMKSRAPRLSGDGRLMMTWP